MSGRGALNWRQQWQQVLVSRAISLGAHGRPDGRTAVTLLYPVESQVALRQTPDAGLHPQKSCYNWSGVSPGDPYPRDSHAPVIKAENCHLVPFSDFRWVCASLDGSHTVLLSCAESINCVLYLTLCDSINYSLPGSSVHGNSPGKILEWVAMPSSRGSSQPRDRIQVSCIAGGFFTVSHLYGTYGEYGSPPVREEY